MSGKISLTASMRANLLSLQHTAKQTSLTQNQLSTGLEVNSAIDNPSSYYTARALTNRANDLDALLDSMGQGIMIIKAATTGLESGSEMLAQAAAVATQALEKNDISASVEDGNFGIATVAAATDYSDYTEIGTGMTADAIEALMTSGAKLVLTGDITLDRGLNITNSDVVLDGNGHKIIFNASSESQSAIHVQGGSATVSNLKIDASGTKVSAIRVTQGGLLTLDNAQGIKVSGDGAKKLVNGDPAIYDGKSNTKAIIGEVGANGLAATAANQFYAPGVSKTDTNFGQGQWYLPSIGELMQVYGTDTSAMTAGNGTSGATGANKALINTALTTAGGDKLAEGYYWSSSEYSSSYSWLLGMSNGYRNYGNKIYDSYVRCFQLLENCFDPLTLSAGTSGDGSGVAVPKVGDIMYSDKTWGTTSNHATATAAGKVAVGVITDVSATGDVTIMNLKDLRFTSTSATGNFNPDNPYNKESGTVGYSYHTTSAKYSEDIDKIPNYNSSALLTAVKSGGTVTVQNIPFTAGGGSAGDGGDASGGGSGGANSSALYGEIISQYDALIKDAFYKGVNLLDGDDLTVRFNEDGSSSLDVSGKKMSSAALGLTTLNWQSKGDIEKAIQEIASALNSIRSFTSELGNNFTIVTNRQDFTENLINVLTEGSDKLTLADMNEKSANMLALQTRQQLAVNALSLASQSAQSVLKLF